MLVLSSRIHQPLGRFLSNGVGENKFQPSLRTAGQVKLHLPRPARSHALFVMGILAMVGAFFMPEAAAKSAAGPSGGYVVGNFSISAQISDAEGPELWMKVNPPKLGASLQNFARSRIWLGSCEPRHRVLRLRLIRSKRLYPDYVATFVGDGQVRIRLHIFAPVALRPEPGFLPTIIVKAQISSKNGWEGCIGASLRKLRGADNTPDIPAPEFTAPQMVRRHSVKGIVVGPAFAGIADNSDARARALTSGVLVVSAPMHVAPGTSRHITFVLGAFDPNGRYALAYKNADKLLIAVGLRSSALARDTRAFGRTLPQTADKQLNRWLRSYASAGILLTKGDRAGHVLTMGYTEMNERDSFWTTGLHLVFWPEIERQMILELVAGQTASGRMSSTILPTSTHGGEIDSSCYFILRVARFYWWYRDRQLLRRSWPAIGRAIDYLVSQDVESVGVPMQRSYWADWKDVPGVQGRSYAPSFALLWLAALRQASDLARELHLTEASRRYNLMADKAAAFVNKPVAAGGMWNGRYYVERWRDGHWSTYVLQDQTLGAYFGVIPNNRLNSIYRALHGNETRWGLRETFPYRQGWSDDDGGTPGNYHNGGIWPYLNFADAAGRYRNGFANSGERILHEVASADLDLSADEQPNEYMNGDTGENKGPAIQGWDADLFSTVYFGMFGLERIGKTKVMVRVRTEPGRAFSSRLVLPGQRGTLQVGQRDLKWKSDNPLRSGLLKVVLSDDR